RVPGPAGADLDHPRAEPLLENVLFRFRLLRRTRRRMLPEDGRRGSFPVRHRFAADGAPEDEGTENDGPDRHDAGAAGESHGRQRRAAAQVELKRHTMIIEWHTH